MKYLLMSIAILCLTACDRKYTSVDDQFSLPPEMKDCKMFSLQSTYGNVVTAIRCPNSSTTASYMNGKARTNTIVIDGVEYESIEE